MASACPQEISSDEDEDVCFVSIVTPLSRQSDDEQFCWADKSKSHCVIAPWKQCRLEQSFINVNENDEEERSSIVCFNDKKMELPQYKLALAKPMLQFIKGARVIAFRRVVDLPYIIDAETWQQNPLYASQDNEPYPGMLAVPTENPNFHVVFFDDGHVQRVESTDIRFVFDIDCFEHVHSNAKNYFQFYRSLEEHSELRPTSGQVFSVELNGNWVLAEVNKIELPLAQFCFMQDNQPDRYEWLYLGSPRIEKVWRRLIAKKLLDKLLDFEYVEENANENDHDCMIIERCTTRAAQTADLAPISNGVELPKNHECNHDCVWLEDRNPPIESYSLFHRPLAVGFKRIDKNPAKRPFYIAPCGLRLTCYDAIRTYLLKTNSKLRIDSFTFFKNFDASQNQLAKKSEYKPIEEIKDKLPITVCGNVRLEPGEFTYIDKNRYAVKGLEFEKSINRCCDCTDNCLDKKKCSCWRLTIEKHLERKPTKNDFNKNINRGYTNLRLNHGQFHEIVECGNECKCNADKCFNRVVQRGLQVKLQLFKTKNRGRGVRTLTDLPPGTFIITYIGEILDGETAAKCEEYCYHYQLSLWAVDPKPPSPSNSKRIRLDSEDVVQDFLNFFPKVITLPNENDTESQSESGRNDQCEEEYVIDSISYGNISRFFNHSCNPNMFVQHVLVEDDERFPAVAFFTNSLVKAGTELTFDYQYDTEGIIPCMCGKKCRNRML